MPLFDILKKIESSKGFKPFTNSDERLNLVAKINAAAKELYTSTDLDNSLMEDLLDMDVSASNITLPPSVGWIRGVRYCDARIRVEVNNIYPRYHHGGFHREVWPLRFRELPKKCLFQDIENQSKLTFTIPEVNDAAFTLIVVGKNDNAQQIKEEVMFSKTDLSQTTTNIFNEVITLFKADRTKNDISILDADDQQLGLWPNWQNDLKHIAFQISDGTNYPYGIYPIEVCYKPHYIPLVEDWDTFQCGSQYDEHIYWKFRENYAFDKEADATEVAKIAGAKEAKLQKDIDEQASLGQTLRINFAPLPVYQVFSGLRLRKYLKRY
jgi:hypothetical protein